MADSKSLGMGGGAIKPPTPEASSVSSPINPETEANLLSVKEKVINDVPMTPDVKIEQVPEVPFVAKVDDPEPEEEQEQEEEEKLSTEPKSKAEPLALEDQLRMQVVKEAATLEARQQQNLLLQTQISRSVARRKDVEDVILRELETLNTRIQTEKGDEEGRLLSLNVLLKKFQEVVTDKEVVIARESKVLEEMLGLSDKITENAILKQLTGAIDKKRDLITLENEILVEIRKYMDEVQSEISLTESKLVRVNDLFNQLPAISDRDAARQYAWLDVEDLEKELSSNFEINRKRSEKLQQLLGNFEKVIQRRGVVLGEVSIPSPSLSSTSTSISSSSSNRGSSVSIPLPSLDTPVNYIKDISETSLALRDSSNDELKRKAVDAITKTSKSFVKLLTGVVNSGKTFATSQEAKDTKMAIELAGEAAGEVGTSLTKTIDSIKLAWSAGMTADEGVSTEVVFENIKMAFKNVFESKDIKENLKFIGTGIMKTTNEVGTAVKVSSNKIANELACEISFEEGVEGVSEGLKVFAAVTQVATARIVDEASQKKV
jgi:hypothetical protein